MIGGKLTALLNWTLDRLLGPPPTLDDYNPHDEDF